MGNFCCCGEKEATKDGSTIIENQNLLGEQEAPKDDSIYDGQGFGMSIYDGSTRRLSIYDGSIKELSIKELSIKDESTRRFSIDMKKIFSIEDVLNKDYSIYDESIKDGLFEIRSIKSDDNNDQNNDKQTPSWKEKFNKVSPKKKYVKEREFGDKELAILSRHWGEAIKDFKRFKIIDYTKETFQFWECTALEYELGNYGTTYYYKITADEEEYTVVIFEGLPHTCLTTRYKGIEFEGCVYSD